MDLANRGFADLSTSSAGTTPLLASAQLWVEEVDELRRLSGAVRDGGVIVDIGTAQGGSAQLFHQATRGRGVSIHTFDPYPSEAAFAALAGTGVVITRASSAAGARGWRHGPIDLIFIDGSHHLVDVAGDFNAWLPHLAPGATVAFHDYDSDERGGLIHFGVQVVVEAVLAQRLLSHPMRAGRVLSGIAGPAALEAADCREALRAMAARVTAAIERDRTGWVALGRPGPVADLLSGVLDLTGVAQADTVDRVRGAAPVLVFERPLGDTVSRLRAQPSFTGDIEPLDNLTLAYVLEYGLSARRDALLALAADRRAFFKWEEVLATLDHAASAGARLSQRIASLPDDASMVAISRCVALEQTRLVCLARMFHAVTGYEL